MGEVDINQEVPSLDERITNPTYLPTSQEVDTFLAKHHSDIDNFFPNSHELPTVESVKEWAKYLIEREQAGAYTESPDGTITILDAGAGDGRIAYFLQLELEQMAPGKFNILPVDINARDMVLNYVKPMTVQDAIDKYKPQVAICSWMSPTVDFTQAFRKCPELQEYILIGARGPIGQESRGATGDAWETWGDVEEKVLQMLDEGASSSAIEDFEASDPQAPYEIDGFARFDMDERFQDKQRSKYKYRINHPTTTVSFRRKSN